MEQLCVQYQSSGNNFVLCYYIFYRDGSIYSQPMQPIFYLVVPLIAEKHGGKGEFAGLRVKKQFEFQG